MERPPQWLLCLTAAILLIPAAPAQTTLPAQVESAAPSEPSKLSSAPNPATTDRPKPRLYRDLDLLRRHGFSEAQQASVSLRIFDHDGATPANLQASDFALIVNGTSRSARVHAPGVSQSSIPALVLLVLPPNQPIIHTIAIRNAEKYFAAQPGELLPWRVGIFDSNAKLTPFTDGRSQLLANLDVVDHTPEPFQYASDAGRAIGDQWDGTWLVKAEDAIGMMQRFDGPKVILAINPLAERMYGLNEQMFAHDGPESLTPVAKTIGAHIYIANVGGPDVYIPGGGAADDHPAQVNTPGGPQLGTSPSYHAQVDPQMVAALNFYAYRTSAMMLTAQDTLGGYANSLSDLAGKIHRDLDSNYSLDFDLTAEDTDKGVPSVEVRMTRHDLKVAILDLIPIGSAPDASHEAASRRLIDVVRKTARHPIPSPDYRITQHVDYFPLHGGLEPLLPMSASVAWTGQGKAPPVLYLVESVEDPALVNVILERAIEVRWDGHSLTWERDGQLRPGNYVWRVTLHDGSGHVYSSAEEKVGVAFPHDAKVAVSSLVLSKGCREGAAAASGLSQRPAKAAADSSANAALNPPVPPHLLIDPMHAADCRVKPEASDNFSASDTLHAFVRIYPVEKLDKNKPDSWTAKFVLHSQSGVIEMEQEIPFTTDSGSGYLASIEMPLDRGTISAGPHTLDVEIHGPGVRKSLKASRDLSILRAPAP